MFWFCSISIALEKFICQSQHELTHRGFLEEVGYEVGDLWSVRSAIEKNNSGFSLLSDLNLLMKFLGSFLS